MKNVILLSLLLLFSCIKKDNNKSQSSDYSEIIEYYSEPDTTQLKNNILEKGDINSFTTLMRIYETPEDSLTSKIEEYSYIMADKYNYNTANYLIARSILRRKMHTNNYQSIKDLDDENKKIVLERLKKCASNNAIICVEILIEYYKSINNESEVEIFEKKLKILID